MAKSPAIADVFTHIKDNDQRALASLLHGAPYELERVGIGESYVLDRTPLMYALECHNFDIAHFLIDSDANVSYRIPSKIKCGFSILTHALTVSRWDDSLLYRISAMDCDIDAYCDHGTTALKQAISEWRINPAHAKIIKSLMEQGADPDFRPPIKRPHSDLDAETAREFAIRIPRLSDDACTLLEIPRKNAAT